jgi:hypothetical protein
VVSPSVTTPTIFPPKEVTPPFLQRSKRIDFPPYYAYSFHAALFAFVATISWHHKTAAVQPAKQSKQVELNLLNSRRKLEEKKCTNLQLLDKSATKTAVPGKLKDAKRKKLHVAGQSGSKVIKPHSIPPKPKHPSNKSKVSTPAPSSTVPTCVTVTPKEPLATVDTSVRNSGSKLDLDKEEEESSEGEFVAATVQGEGGDNSTISSHTMSQITTPGSTITVDQHKSILNSALKGHHEVKVL